MPRGRSAPPAAAANRRRGLGAAAAVNGSPAPSADDGDSPAVAALAQALLRTASDSARTAFDKVMPSKAKAGAATKVGDVLGDLQVWHVLVAALAALLVLYGVPAALGVSVDNWPPEHGGPPAAPADPVTDCDGYGGCACASDGFAKELAHQAALGEFLKAQDEANGVTEPIAKPGVDSCLAEFGAGKLGLKFTSGGVVEKSGGQAEELGVKVGMRIVEVNSYKFVSAGELKAAAAKRPLLLKLQQPGGE